MPFTSETAKRLRGPGGRKKGDPVKKAASIIAREFIEEHVEPVLQSYLKLAKGYYDTRYTDSGKPYEVFVSDGPTTRHFVDKLLPEIKHDESQRPIAIQVVIEQSTNGNGRAHADTEGAWSSGRVLIGGE